MRTSVTHHSALRGFTLIELVVAIVLTAVVVGFATMFLTTPVQTYFTQTRRAELTESSEAMTRRMSADLRQALPNSIRISNSATRSIVELLLVEEVAFFRTAGSADANRLLATSNDSTFTSIGQFRRGFPRPLNLLGMRLSVGNTGGGATNAYSGTGAMTSTATTIRLIADAAADEDTVQMIGQPATFQTLPASNRMYLVSGPVTYICNSAARTLRRYSNYAVLPAIPVSEAEARFGAANVENTLVGRDVVACRLSCSNGVAPCNDTLIVDMAVSRANVSPDVMRVFLEEHVENVP